MDQCRLGPWTLVGAGGDVRDHTAKHSEISRSLTQPLTQATEPQLHLILRGHFPINQKPNLLMQTQPPQTLMCKGARGRAFATEGPWPFHN